MGERRTSHRVLGAVALAALAMLAAACGGGEGGSDPARIVPPRATLYLDATIDPQGDQEQAVRSILGRFPRGDQTRDLLVREIEQEARESNTPIDFDKDVEPWLGDRAGIFFTTLGPGEPKGAAIVATTDEGKARDAIDKLAAEDDKERSHEGVDYRVSDEGTASGVIEGFAVFGDEAEFKATVDAAKGSSLSESGRWEKATADIPDDRIGTGYLDQGALVQAAGGQNAQGEQAARCLLGAAARQPLAVSTQADRDGVTFESVLPGVGKAPSGLFTGTEAGLLPTLPADAWLAFGQAHLGEGIKRVIDCLGGALGGGAARDQFRQATGLDLDRDLLSWMGDAGLFVRGTNQADIGGGLVLETRDPAASRRALAKVLPATRRQLRGARVRPSPLPDVEAGFIVRQPGAPEFHAAQRGKRVVLAFSRQAAEDGLAPPRPLSGSRTFKAAGGSLGEGYGASFYLAVQPILALVETGGPTDVPGYRQALPYLEKLSFLVSGNKQEDVRLLSRARLQLSK